MGQAVDLLRSRGSWTRTTNPEFDIMFGEEAEMGGMDWAALGGEVAEWTSATFMGTLDAVVGSVAGAAMGLVYMSPLIAISELVPIVAQLVKGNWWIAGYDEEMRNYQYVEAELGSIMGTYWELADYIESLYRTTPKYVWFSLAGNTPPTWFVDDGQKGDQQLLDTHIWGYKGWSSHYSFKYTKLSGSGLWKRARICTVEGTGMGLMDDSKKGFWVYLKLCNEDCDTELAEAVSIWFRCGVDGYLLPDTDDVRNLCTLYLKLINAMLPTAEPKKKDDSAYLERLQRDLETLREELRPMLPQMQDDQELYEEAIEGDLDATLAYLENFQNLMGRVREHQYAGMWGNTKEE